MVNLSVREGVFPTPCKEALECPLLKKLLVNSSILTNFHPVSHDKIQIFYKLSRFQNSISMGLRISNVIKSLNSKSIFVLRCMEVSSLRFIACAVQNHTIQSGKHIYNST